LVRVQKGRSTSKALTDREQQKGAAQITARSGKYRVVGKAREKLKIGI